MAQRFQSNILAAALGMCLGALPALSVADVTLPKDLSTLLTGDLLDAEALIAQERSRNAALAAALRAENATGIRRQYRNREVVEITPATAAMMALEAGLAFRGSDGAGFQSLQRSELGARIAKEALIQAEAILDPTLTLTATYSEKQNFDRVEGIIDKAKKGTVAVDTDGDGVIDDHRLFLAPGGVINFLSFDKPRPAGLYPTTEVASESELTGPDTDYTYNFQLTQQYRPGSSFTLEFELVDKERFFINNAGARKAGLATFGSFGQPWTAEISGTYATPVPFMAGYGEFSGANSSITIATITRDRALDSVQQAINNTLVAVDQAYYDLTFAVMNLEIAIENRKQVERLLERTKRMFELREVTARSKSQVEAELESVKGAVEIAWNTYITASNSLNELLDADQTQMFVPVGYAGMFRNDFQVELQDPGKLEAENKPDFAVQQKNVAIAEVARNVAAVNAKPDMDLSISLKADQGGRNAAFGFNFTHALENLIEPDKVSMNATLSLNRPWGNRALEANKEIARLGHEASERQLDLTRNNINRRLDDALVDYNSAKAQAAVEQRAAELAHSRYEKATGQQQRRSVTEFELVTQSRALLDANRRWIAALTAWKKAESRVLAEAGLLARHYGEKTALNEIDRQRIRLLASQQDFQYFGGTQ